MEILAPAGGMESVYPAVRMGANAVYLGAWKMSARSFAHNFNREELKNAVEYCHARNVKVYLACNTLLKDEELSEAMSIIRYACSIPVDALIVQDLGLISLIREFAPDMRLHASTQMSVHNLKGVEMLERMGFKRVVLSRELSKKEIEEIAKNTSVELEVFVHGALCMSVSGQCYFSAMLGSRSGNRGACAQPCRLPFSVQGGTGHDLSLKDNSVISHLRELEKIGIASAKIEGRMKRPEYVAVAVTACRQSLDRGEVDKDISEKLNAVFSRSGFTDGYFTGKRGAEMFGIRSKEDVTASDERVFASIRTMYKDEKPLIPLNFEFRLKENEPIRLDVSDNSGNEVGISGAVPEKALKTAVSEEKCRQNLTKTGGTPFYAERFYAEVDDGLSVPVSELNSVRRQALERLIQKRTERIPVQFSEVTFPQTDTRARTVPKYFRGRFTSGDISDVFLESELIYVPINLQDDKYNELLDRGFALAVEIPRGIFGLEKYVYERLKHIQKLGINEVLASNIGALEIAKELKMDIHGGFGLNITNTKSAEWAEKEGLLDIELSFELKLEQIEKIGGKIPTGIISYGFLPLMLTRNCPVQNDGKGCKSCKKAPVLRDRKGMEFPVQCYGACTEILNSVPLILSDRRKEIKGVDFEVLRFSIETPDEIQQALQSYQSGVPNTKQFTRGLYYRGVF